MSQKRILLNDKLGEPYRPFREEPSLTVAEGWAPWWLDTAEKGPNWQNRRPVFDRITLDKQPAQQVSTPWGTHTAGLWQQVPSAPGNEYELTVEGQAWSSDDPKPGSQLEASDVNLQIGIDPSGGLDPESPLIVWSDIYQPLSHWQTLRLVAEAEADVITIYLKSAPTLPKRQQTIFWRNAFLRPIGRHKRSINIVGAGDTHIVVEPERPQPGDAVTAVISSTRAHKQVDLHVKRPNEEPVPVAKQGQTVDEGRTIWRFTFDTDIDGLYEVRFIGDRGARLLALRLLRVAREVQLVPSDSARTTYKRVYVLLPPTADEKWLLAAARGSFDGRFTVGFSADDAGLGDLENRHVLAVNPHHWPQVLTAAWFQQHYPGVTFTPIVANKPADLEHWLRNWPGA
jgi:hypothetical protein